VQPMNPVRAAILRRRSDPCPPRQVANGWRSNRTPGPQVVSDDAAEAVKAAWLPLIPGQAIPMIGERVDADPCD
jgi:hypothetical protein